MTLAFTFEGASIRRLEQDCRQVTMNRFAQCSCFSIPLGCYYLHKTQIYKILRFATWRAFGYWHFVATITDALLFTALTLRLSGLAASGGKQDQLRLHSFQVLSFVAPLIWCVFDHFRSERSSGTSH